MGALELFGVGKLRMVSVMAKPLNQCDFDAPSGLVL